MYLRINVYVVFICCIYLIYLYFFFKFCLDNNIVFVLIFLVNFGRYIVYLFLKLFFSLLWNYLLVVRILYLEVGKFNFFDFYYILSILKGVWWVLGEVFKFKLFIIIDIFK